MDREDKIGCLTGIRVITAVSINASPFAAENEIIFIERLILVLACCKEPMKFVRVYMEMVDRILFYIATSPPIRRIIQKCNPILENFSHPVAKNTYAVFEKVLGKEFTKSSTTQEIIAIQKMPAYSEIRNELLTFCESILTQELLPNKINSKENNCRRKRRPTKSGG